MEINQDFSTRQGDVFFKPVSDLQGMQLFPCKDGNIVRYGEESGHVHWFDTPKQVLFESLAGEIFARPEEPTPLVHSERNGFRALTKGQAKEHEIHITYTQPAGDYRLIDERTEDAFDFGLKHLNVD